MLKAIESVKFDHQHNVTKHMGEVFFALSFECKARTNYSFDFVTTCSFRYIGTIGY
jgi:hypothetical protein